MGKQTVLAKKRRGPPPTGKGVQVVVRSQPDPLAAIDKWVARQPDHPTRAEAIRRLVELGLTLVRPKQASHSRARKAHELAGKHLDRLADQSATAEEQTRRKHRLLKGPEEFRSVRIDRAKKK
jgi:hypothetical protein